MLRVTTYYVVVSIIFLFSPVFGEDSHFGSYFSDGFETINQVVIEIRNSQSA